jgi:hypothetical protein
MAWHTRGSRRYYYRSRWQNGRSVRLYVGTGPFAEAAAAMDAQRRVEREIQARAWRDEQARCEAAQVPLLELCRVTDLLAHAVLLAAGFHQHDRAWRRKRVRKQQPPNN